MFSHARVLVMGDVMLDRYLWGDAKRISPEAPVPVINVKERSALLGGAGNVAANLHGLGCASMVLGVCGPDDNGDYLQRLFEDRQIETCLIRDPQRQTITKTRIMARGQQLFRLDEEDIVPLSPATRDALFTAFTNHLKNYQVVILSDYGKGIFQTPHFCQKVIQTCRNVGIPVFVDPKGKDWDRYEGADCVTPNMSELSLVCASDISADMEKLTTSAQKLTNTYEMAHLLATLGERGMCLVANTLETPYMIAAKAKEVFDVSGAGDTVIATLAAGVAAGLTYRHAASIANTAAGVVVGKIGTQPIDRKELEIALNLQEKDLSMDNNRKTMTLDAAKLQVQAWRASGERIVFTNGCYDLLHPGHIDLLHRSSMLGDKLVVGLNTDLSIKRLKGEKRPILNEHDRSAILSALSYVDLVILFGEDTPLNLIAALQPDILVKGADYKLEDVVGRDVVEKNGGRVVLVPLLEGYSTTGIVNRLLSAYDSKSQNNI